MDQYIGDYQVDLEAVLAVPTPPPSGAHHPIGHDVVYRAVVNEIEAAHAGISETYHALFRGGDRYIGLAVTDLAAARGREMIVGWFNSHDKSHAATLLFGERVMVCFNLVLTAEVKIARKHTRNIARDLPELVPIGFQMLREHREEHARRLEAYHGTRLGQEPGHHLVIQMLDAGVFPASRIPAVLGEWREPSYSQNNGDWNVDRLYNAVTCQRQSLRTMVRRHARMHGILDTFCGLRSASSRAGGFADTSVS
jgi:hypothetical protein